MMTTSELYGPTETVHIDAELNIATFTNIKVNDDFPSYLNYVVLFQQQEYKMNVLKIEQKERGKLYKEQVIIMEFQKTPTPLPLLLLILFFLVRVCLCGEP